MLCVSGCVFGEDGNYNAIMGGLRAELNAVALVAWEVQFLFFCQFFWFCANDGFRGCSTLLFKEQNLETRREKERERELTLASERRGG